MTQRQLKTWLTDQLKEAEPLDRESASEDPQAVAIKATKKLGLLEYGSGELYHKATLVETPQECASVLIDCLALLPDENNLADLGNAELLTVAQAATRYNIGERTLYRLVSQNELPHHRIGSAIRIKPIDLVSYLEGQTQPVVGSLFD